MRLLSTTNFGASNITTEQAIVTVSASAVAGVGRMAVLCYMQALNTASCVRELRIYTDGVSVNSGIGPVAVNNVPFNHDAAAFAETHGGTTTCLSRIIPHVGTSGDLDIRLISSNSGDTAVYGTIYVVSLDEMDGALATHAGSDGSIAAAIDAIDTAAAAIQAKTDNLPAAPAAQAKLDTLHDTRIPGVIQPQTGDSFARLGAPAGASVSADVAAVKTDTGNLVSRVTATLFTGITSLAEWLGLLAGKQVGDATARTELRATGAGSGTFDETSDSIEALADAPGAPAEVDEAAIAAAVWTNAQRTLTQSIGELIELAQSGRVLIVTHYSWSLSLTGLGDLTDADDLIFSLKSDPRQSDAAAAVQVRQTLGLVRINGAAAATAGDGAIVIDDAAAGDVTISLEETATELLDEIRSGRYDLAVLRSGGAKNVLALGPAEVRLGITRATI
ncbi:MAG: hypothetical protein HUU22_04840 [Phycisphaerae bacterium]|nr:hypothetical protein [Phycisphaerae bacterium]NUQ45339.1 hypothetical protein [Phycisphaerae bacterium]